MRTVAPHTGAWIETFEDGMTPDHIPSRPSRGGVDQNAMDANGPWITRDVAPGGVDRNEYGTWLIGRVELVNGRRALEDPLTPVGSRGSLAPV